MTVAEFAPFTIEVETEEEAVAFLTGCATAVHDSLPQDEGSDVLLSSVAHAATVLEPYAILASLAEVFGLSEDDEDEDEDGQDEATDASEMTLDDLLAEILGSEGR